MEREAQPYSGRGNTKGDEKTLLTLSYPEEKGKEKKRGEEKEATFFRCPFRREGKGLYPSPAEGRWGPHRQSRKKGKERKGKGKTWFEIVTYEF